MFYDQEQPSSASKIVKIAHQQKLWLLLSTGYCLVFELLLSDLYSEFELYLELQNCDSNAISLVGKIRHEATNSMHQEEPSSASKIVKIAQLRTLGLLLSNCYCLVF
jgi:hypothetical protein